ncbi:MAG: hypothetical protein M1133_10490 [Armatimonadetes bacterium]|nr:hypothetical protein [Armatimonadota bacterium]
MMSKKAMFEYAKTAALAEQRILELLDGALREDFADRRSKVDLQKSARPRQGHQSSGRFN